MRGIILPPKRRIYVPREYQPMMTNHIIDVKRGCVFARMGLGKTTSALTAVDILFMSGYETKPALVLAPLRVAATTWPDEAKKWEHLRHIDVHPIIGGARVREAQLIKALRGDTASVFTMNYENIPWLVDFLKHQRGGFQWPFGMTIADESTKLKSLRMSFQKSKTGKTYLTGQGGLRTRLLASIAHRDCSRWVNLTGTPSPNGLKDLWGQVWYCDGGERLGRSYSAFSQRWFYKTHDGFGLEPHPFAQKQIQDKIKDICISLDPADYFDLEEPIETTIEVEMPPKAKALYKKMEREMFVEIQDDFKKHRVEALNAAAKTMKCLQLANGAAYVDKEGTEWREIHRAKIDALEDIIEEAGGMPVLVAYHFKSDLARLRKHFPQARVLDKNPKTVADWNAGRIPILLAHPDSAGHGLNLQDGGNILVFFSLTWDLEKFEQIKERLGPMRQLQAGHNRNVFYYYIVTRGTVESLVRRRLEKKERVQNILMDALKASKSEGYYGLA